MQCPLEKYVKARFGVCSRKEIPCSNFTKQKYIINNVALIVAKMAQFMAFSHDEVVHSSEPFSVATHTFLSPISHLKEKIADS
jgi:hypothetical protein